MSDLSWRSAFLNIMAKKHFWTPARDRALVHLWSEMTAREIAVEIGAASRSAVLGRYYRLNGRDEFYTRNVRAKREADRKLLQDAKQECVMVLFRNIIRGMKREIAIQMAVSHGLNNSDIARALGLSRERVRQIRTRKEREKTNHHPSSYRQKTEYERLRKIKKRERDKILVEFALQTIRQTGVDI